MSGKPWSVPEASDNRALIVLLNAPNRWQTATQMLNKALEQRTTTAMRAGCAWRNRVLASPEIQPRPRGDATLCLMAYS